MKKVVIKILVGIAFIYLGYNMAEKSDSLITQEDYDKAEGICLNIAKTEATAQGDITEISVAGAEVYLVEYIYVVEGTEFKANYSINDLDDLEKTLILWYDKTFPKAYSIKEPCSEFELIKKEKSIGNSYVYLFSGLGLILVGAILVWTTVKGTLVKLIRTAIKK